MKLTFTKASLSLLCVTFIGALTGCTNDDLLETGNSVSSQTRSEACEKDSTLRLYFENEEQLRTFISTGGEEGNGSSTRSTIPQTVKPVGFVSLVSPVSNKDTEMTYYEALGYDTLVPNINFAKLLNVKGEMEVSNKIVKITADGTFIVPKENEQNLIDLIDSKPDFDKIRSECKNKMCTLDGNITFYNTFEQNPQDYTTLSEGNYSELDDDYFDIDYRYNSTLNTRSSTSEPNFNDFSTFSANRHTIVGKVIQNIIGSTKTHTINYNSKRRVRGSFYFYNYGVYSEIGVKGWTDKKNWIGWSKIASDELRVGWKNVILDVPMSDELKYALSGKAFYVSPQSVMMGKKNIKAAILVDNNFPPTFWEKIAQKGVKAIIEFAKSRYDSSKTKDIQKSEAFIIGTPTELKFIATDDVVTKCNEKYYCHTFSEEFMNITIGWSNIDGIYVNNLNGNNIGNAGAILKFIVDLFTQKHTTLVSGEVYICALLGNEWRGMKIIKN